MTVSFRVWLSGRDDFRRVFLNGSLVRDGYGPYCGLGTTSIDLVFSIPLSCIVGTSGVKGRGHGRVV